MKLRIENMTCGGCARSVTATIKELDEHARVEIDVETKLIKVETGVHQDEIIAALTEDGFPPVAV